MVRILFISCDDFKRYVSELGNKVDWILPISSESAFSEEKGNPSVSVNFLANIILKYKPETEKSVTHECEIRDYVENIKKLGIWIDDYNFSISHCLMEKEEE